MSEPGPVVRIRLTIDELERLARDDTQTPYLPGAILLAATALRRAADELDDA